MSTTGSFVELGDRAEIGDEVVIHGDHGNLVSAIVADRAVSPLSQIMHYRVVDTWFESGDPDADKWVGHDRLYMIHPLGRRGEALNARPADPSNWRVSHFPSPNRKELQC